MGIIKKYPRLTTIAVVCVSLLVVGALDFITGHDLSLSFFYLVSIAVSVILLGNVAGVLCSIFASGITLLEQLAWHIAVNVALWNTGMRLATLLVAAFILDWWWKARQGGYAARGSPEPETSGRDGMPRKLLVSAGLVYIPFAVIVLCECYVKVRFRPEISLSFFYLLPLIAAVAVTRLKGGVIYSIFASAAFLFVQHYVRHFSWGAGLWNAFMRLAVLLTIAQALWSAVNAKPRQPDPA